MPPNSKVIGSETNRDLSFGSSVFDINLEVVSVTLERSRFIGLNSADVVTVLAGAGILDGKFIGRDDYKTA